jgi:hypothetical protein
MLENLEPPKPIINCKVAFVIESLDKKDADILLKAIADRDKWSALALSTALMQRGLKLSDSTIQRHRNKQCQCEKENNA